MPWPMSPDSCLKETPPHLADDPPPPRGQPSPTSWTTLPHLFQRVGRPHARGRASTCARLTQLRGRPSDMPREAAPPPDEAAPPPASGHPTSGRGEPSSRARLPHLTRRPRHLSARPDLLFAESARPRSEAGPPRARGQGISWTMCRHFAHEDASPRGEARPPRGAGRPSSRRGGVCSRRGRASLGRGRPSSRKRPGHLQPRLRHLPREVACPRARGRITSRTRWPGLGSR